MPTILRAGNLQFPAEFIFDRLISSPLLGQLTRELTISETLDRWQPDPPINSIDRSTLSPATAAIDDRDLKLQQFKQANWSHKLGSYYLTRKSQLDRAIYSILQVEDGALAQELFFRIQSGEQTFAKLARQYSQAANAIDGGYSAMVPFSRMHPLVATQLARLAPGELAPILAIDRVYTILRLERLVPIPFDDRLRQALLDELFERWLQAQVASQLGLAAVCQDLN